MKNQIKEYAVITAGMFLAAVAIYFFMLPLNIVMGSITGLAMIIARIVPLSLSMILLVLNMTCLLAGFLLLGREFGVKTVYVSVFLPLILKGFEYFFPDSQSFTGDVILDAASCIILVSAGQTLMFQANASSGGLDIIAKIMNKYLHVDIGKALTITGVMTVLCSVFVYDTKAVIVGLLATYLNGQVVDEYISGFSRKKRVCIISDQHEEIRQYILTGINRGVTLYLARGGYEGRERVEIVTILNKNEYALLMNHIKEMDESAFVTVSTVSEIAGVWNRRGITTTI